MNFIPKRAGMIVNGMLNRDKYATYVIENELHNIVRLVDYYDMLTLEEKYKLIQYYYFIKYDISDIFDLINAINGTNYSKFIDVSTKMQIEGVSYKDHGSDFTWWQTFNRVHLICAAEEGYLLEGEYGYKELEKLIKRKRILPFSEHPEEIERFSKDKEDYQRVFSIINYGINISDILFEEDQDGQHIKDDNGNLILLDNYYEIEIKAKMLPYLMELIEQKLDYGYIYINAMVYLKSLIRTINKEGNSFAKKEIRSLSKYISEKQCKY